VASSPVQLLILHFGPAAGLDGGLVPALRRVDLGTSLNVLDALFVRKNPETRRLATESALSGEATGGAGSVLREVVAGLAPGDAVAVLLVEHVWTRRLDDEVARLGGATMVSRFVDGATLADVTEDMRDAARHV
jgi:hypothetical protein